MKKNNFKKVGISALCLLLFSLSAISLPNKIIKWQKSFGGSSGDSITVVRQTADGGYIIGGAATSRDGDVQDHDTLSFWWESDAWIIKTNSKGDTLWTKTLGGSYGDYVKDIIPVTGGGYITCIQTSSDDGDLDTNYGSVDTWIVRLNAAGNIMWSKLYGGTKWDEPYNIFQLKDGGYIIGGATLSDTINGIATGFKGGYDYWLLRIDSVGTIKWTKAYGGSSYDTYEAFTPDKDMNSFYMCGWTWADTADGDITDPGNGYYDYWVVKTDSNGVMVWNKQFGGTDFDAATAITSTNDGGCAVVGMSVSNDGDVNGNNGNLDYWITKISSTGSLSWEKNFGGEWNDIPRFISKVANGGYLIGGASFSETKDASNNFGYEDAWIIKTDTSGKKIDWQVSLGGDTTDYVRFGMQTSDQEFILAGVTYSKSNDVLKNNGWSDGWLIKLGCTPPLEAQVCMITVDSATGKNVIIWEETSPANYTKGYNIYRETSVLNKDTLLAFVPRSALSEYMDTDPNVDPSAFAHRYCVAAVDTCDNVWDKSPYHSAARLWASKGAVTGEVNVQWNNYIGDVIDTYTCYRYTKSNPQLDSLFSVSGGANPSWTDKTAPMGDSIYYFLAVKGLDCNTSKTFYESRSNTTKYSTGVGIAENKSSFANLKVIPNPSNGKIDLNFTSLQKQSVFIKLCNLQGQVVFQEVLTSVSGVWNKNYDFSYLAKGVYQLYLTGDNTNAVKKIIIE